MAKRFFDSGLFDDEWFAELKIEGKLLWVYYLTKCDHAGLLKYNKKLMEFQTGLKGIETVFEQLGNRIVTVTDTLLFCPKFLSYQYPGFPNLKMPAQRSAWQLLIKNGLVAEDSDSSEFLNSYITVTKELKNSISLSKGYSKGISKKVKTEISIPTLEDFVEYGMIHLGHNVDYAFGLTAKYDEWRANGWRTGFNRKIIDWEATLRATLPHIKPFTPVKKDAPLARQSGNLNDYTDAPK